MNDYTEYTIWEAHNQSFSLKTSIFFNKSNSLIFPMVKFVCYERNDQNKKVNEALFFVDYRRLTAIINVLERIHNNKNITKPVVIDLMSKKNDKIRKLTIVYKPQKQFVFHFNDHVVASEGKYSGKLMFPLNIKATVEKNKDQEFIAIKEQAILFYEFLSLKNFMEWIYNKVNKVVL